MSVHWLGDFVFVESGLGVRVKFDLTNTVYLTVTAEHLAATRGLCGVYNNNADGEEMYKQTHAGTCIQVLFFTVYDQVLFILNFNILVSWCHR